MGQPPSKEVRAIRLAYVGHHRARPPQPKFGETRCLCAGRQLHLVHLPSNKQTIKAPRQKQSMQD
eukprot:6785615-Prorocentrum_lima.AAC.1